MDSTPGVRHNWDFGDGTVASTFNDTVSHLYFSYGQFLVTQVVIDSLHRCRDSSAQFVNLPAPPPPCGIAVNETSDTVHHLYTFTAITSVSPGATDTIKWTINDTLVGTGDSLQKNLTGGPYNVCALLTTSYSCSAQSCVTINPQDSVPTQPPPPPDTCTIGFTAVQKANKPNEYTFTIIDSKEYDSVFWTIMGPDSLSAGPYRGPRFTYTAPDTGFYYVYVSAEKRAGCAVSNVQVIHIDSIPARGHNIASYPNPATTQVGLTVTLTSYTNIDVRVYNSMGVLALTQTVSGYPGNNQITLPIGNLPAGIYYIELQYGDTILRSKVQKL